MPYEIPRRSATYVVYEKREADERGLAYLPFREITGPTSEAAIWALTDDGYVAECLNRKTYTDSRGRSRDLVSLSFARGWVPGTKALLFEAYLETGHFGGTSPKSWIVREARTERARRVVAAYVAMMVSPNGIDWMMLARIYRPGQPVRSVRQLFRQKRIKGMIRDELQRVLSGEGITEQRILRMYIKAFDKAEKTGNPSAMRSVAKDLADMLDMKPDKRDVHPLLTGGFVGVVDGDVEDVIDDVEIPYHPVLPKPSSE